MEITQLTGLTFIILILGFIGISVLSDRFRPIVALLIVFVNALLTSIPSVLALTTVPQSGSLLMPHALGLLTIKIDSLSAWFILIINFTSINGVLYGTGYLRSYSHLPVNRQIHWIFYILSHISMVWVCMFEQGIAFLVAWELMSLSSLMLVIFEYENKDTLKAGLNYMVQMHISVAFLTIGFIWLFFQTGSFNFSALSGLSQNSKSIWIFAILFIGFAIKAGFLPFHTWLPHAHPAAPSHISGVMSGVIVKMGIYGIFRIISYLQQDQALIGEIILGLSLITAVFGIANAAMKNDFKRMLAFCTIENIGIIGIGVGLGLIGWGKQNEALMILGFSGAMLHTLNHSLFKSLLFFGAGSIYQQTHTRNIERLGGLVRKMPYTAVFFLIGALAIGALPPFNGFVSEFLIYAGLFKGLGGLQGASLVILLVLTIAGLSIVGGMSIFTFTKTFGLIFLGNPRKTLRHELSETVFIMHLPQYLIVAAMLLIALMPQFFFVFTYKIIDTSFISGIEEGSTVFAPLVENIAMVGRFSLLFIGILVLIFIIRWMFIRSRDVSSYETWGCGYVAPVKKAQYTGRSFVRSFGLLFSFLVKERKNVKKIPKTTLYPPKHSYSVYYFDLIEKYIISPFARRLTFILNYFQFIQNGQIQSYVIYGLFFIILIFLGSALHLIN